MARQKEQEAQPAAQEREAGNISQIRDILLGPYQREQTRRLDELEQNIQRVTADISDQMQRLEDKLLHALQGKSTDIDARLSELDKRIAAGQAEDEARDAAMDKDLKRRLNELESHIASEMESAEKLVSSRLAAFKEDTEAALRRLGDDKTDRADLGDYLTEIGMRLKGEQGLSQLEASLMDVLDGGTGKQS